MRALLLLLGVCPQNLTPSVLLRKHSALLWNRKDSAPHQHPSALPVPPPSCSTPAQHSCLSTGTGMLSCSALRAAHGVGRHQQGPVPSAHGSSVLSKAAPSCTFLSGLYTHRSLSCSSFILAQSSSSWALPDPIDTASTTWWCRKRPRDGV